MPQQTQLFFKHHEVLTALIKLADLHEGEWQLIVSFNIAAMNMGPTPNEMVPAAAVGVTQIGIQKATPDSPASLTLDASVVNPRAPAASRGRSARR